MSQSLHQAPRPGASPFTVKVPCGGVAAYLVPVDGSIWLHLGGFAIELTTEQAGALADALCGVACIAEEQAFDRAYARALDLFTAGGQAGADVPIPAPASLRAGLVGAAEA